MDKFYLVLILILVAFTIPNAFAISFEIHAEQYRIGHDITLILHDPDLNLDSDKAESYSLDLIAFHFGNDKVTLGPKGDIDAFDPNPSRLRETGDNTGIFYTVVKIPRTVDGKTVKFGEKIAFEYTDAGAFASVFVGENQEKVLAQPTSQKPVQSDIRVAIPSGNSLPGCEKRNNCFMPSELTIFQGQTVTWVNMDSVVHTVTSRNLQQEPDNAGITFNSAGMESGEEFSNTFNEVGTFQYFCSRHPRMTGVVIVQSSLESETVDSTVLIPSWIKNNAKWWSLNLISTSDFIEGTKYLIKQEIINFPKEGSLERKDIQKDLTEIRKNSELWSEGALSDPEFLKSIQSLFNEESPKKSAKLYLTPKSYRFGQPVTITLIDPDLNLSSDLVDIYRVIDDPNSPFVDTVGSNDGGILLEIRIKDMRYHRCTINGIEHGGLASTGFTLVETGPSTGIFEGIFKVPTKICNKSNTELISSAGGSISIRYHDFRDSFGQPNVLQTR